MEFDPEVLIEEVRRRPPLWDPSRLEYRLKDVKAGLWREIAQVFGGKDAPKRERNDLVRQLQKKFKGLRDSFSREETRRRKARRAPAAAGPLRHRRTYVYYEQLAFLRGAKRDGDAGGGGGSSDDDGDASAQTLKVEERSEDEYDDSEDEWHQPPSKQKCKVLRSLPPPADPVACAAPDGGGGGGGGGDGESERMFLLSLVEPLRQVPARMRLAVQMDMMSVIQNALNHPGLVFADAGSDV